MKVITISGKAQNGKDTTAGLLKAALEADGYKVLITHYADLLKYICKQFFGYAYIFREVSENENDSFYEMVEDEEKINALSKVFAELLDDVDFEG